MDCNKQLRTNNPLFENYQSALVKVALFCFSWLLYWSDIRTSVFGETDFQVIEQVSKGLLVFSISQCMDFNEIYKRNQNNVKSFVVLLGFYIITFFSAYIMLMSGDIDSKLHIMKFVSLMYWLILLFLISEISQDVRYKIDENASISKSEKFENLSLYLPENKLHMF